MTSRIAIIAALPREISSLVHGWRADENNAEMLIAWSDKAVVVCAGMGTVRARVAAQEALKHGPLHRMISAGWCGALNPGLKGGSVRRPSRVVDAVSFEKYDTGSKGGVLVTTNQFANRAEKQRLARSYGADLVDMEASAVAEVAEQAGIPFSAVKAISDEFDFELPGLERFVTTSGGFREGAFALYLALRPYLWRRAWLMGRISSRAARNLCRELKLVLSHDMGVETAQ